MSTKHPDHEEATAAAVSDLSLLYELSYRLLRFKYVIVAAVLAAIAAGVFYSHSRATYSASALMLVQVANNDVIKALSSEGGLGQSFNKDDFIEKLLLTLNTSEFRTAAARAVMVSPNFETIRLFLEQPSKSIVPTIRQMMNRQISHVADTKLEAQVIGLITSSCTFAKSSRFTIEVAARTESGEISVILANAVNQIAVRELTRRFLQESDKSVAYVQSKIGEVADRLQQNKHRIAEIRGLDAYSVEAREGDLIKRIARVKGDLEVASTKLRANATLIREYRLSAASAGASAELGAGDHELARIASDQVDILRRKREHFLAQGVSPQSIDIKEINQSIERMRAIIASEGGGTSTSDARAPKSDGPSRRNFAVAARTLETENEQLKAQVSADKELLLALHNDGKKLPQQETEFGDLIKEVDLDYKLYSDLRRQAFLLDLQRISLENRVSVLESALAGSAARKPSPSGVFFLAMMIGLIGGCYAAYVLDRHDPLIMSQRDLLSLNVHFAGNIPRFSGSSFINWRPKGTILRLKKFGLSRDEKFAAVDLNGPMASAFRRLRAKVIHFRSSHHAGAKVVSVHSAMSGDGKTFLAYHLALAIAGTGKKCLLIDGDIIRKTLSISFLQGDAPGFCENLSDGDLAATPVMALRERLDMLPSGKRQTKGSHVIDSVKLGALLAKLRLRYDYIVIDTPPAGPVPEAAEIAAHADVSLIVASCRKTRLHELVDAVEILASGGAQSTYVVLNRSAMQKFGSMDHSYRYYATEAEVHQDADAA